MSIEMRGKEFSSTKVVAGAAIASGEIFKVGAMVGVAFDAIASGATGVMVYSCDKIEVAKAADALTAGDAIYFDAVAKNVTSTSTSNTLCGRVLKDAASGAAVVEIDLKGYLAI